MTTTHTITAEIEKLFTLPGSDCEEVAYPEIAITYSFTGGRPETYDAARGGPGGWDPADSDEVEFIRAELINGGGLAPEPFQIDEWARAWLDDRGYDAACRHAREDRKAP